MPRSLTTPVRRAVSSTRMRNVASALVLLLLSSVASALDTSTFSLSGQAASAAGGSMTTAIGGSILAWVQLIRGPGLAVCLVAGMIFTVWGWYGGNKAALWTGFVGMGLAAIFGSLFIFV